MNIRLLKGDEIPLSFWGAFESTVWWVRQSWKATSFRDSDVAWQRRSTPNYLLWNLKISILNI